MSQEQAKKLLVQMLQHYSLGTLLHFLGEHFREMSEVETDETAKEQLLTAESALFVFGCGFDTACFGLGGQ